MSHPRSLEDPWTTEEIATIFKVVKRAEQILANNHYRTTPTAALFEATKEVLPQHGFDKDDPRMALVLFKIGGSRHTCPRETIPSLTEKFISVFLDLNIHITINGESIDPYASSDAAGFTATTDGYSEGGTPNPTPDNQRATTPQKWFPAATVTERELDLADEERLKYKAPPAPEGIWEALNKSAAARRTYIDTHKTPAGVTDSSSDDEHDDMAALAVNTHQTTAKVRTLTTWGALLQSTLQSAATTAAMAIDRDREALKDHFMSIWISIAGAAHMLAAQFMRRAHRAYELTLLYKGFTHWQPAADEEVERTKVARRHMQRKKAWDRWTIKTLADKVAATKFRISSVNIIWHGVTIYFDGFYQLARQIYQLSLARSVITGLLREMQARVAAAMRPASLKKSSLGKWLSSSEAGELLVKRVRVFAHTKNIENRRRYIGCWLAFTAFLEDVARTRLEMPGVVDFTSRWHMEFARRSCVERLWSQHINYEKKAREAATINKARRAEKVAEKSRQAAEALERMEQEAQRGAFYTGVIAAVQEWPSLARRERAGRLKAAYHAFRHQIREGTAAKVAECWQLAVQQREMQGADLLSGMTDKDRLDLLHKWTVEASRYAGMGSVAAEAEVECANNTWGLRASELRSGENSAGSLGSELSAAKSLGDWELKNVKIKGLERVAEELHKKTMDPKRTVFQWRDGVDPGPSNPGHVSFLSLSHRSSTKGSAWFSESASTTSAASGVGNFLNSLVQTSPIKEEQEEEEDDDDEFIPLARMPSRAPLAVSHRDLTPITETSEEHRYASTTPKIPLSSTEERRLRYRYQ